MPSESKRIGISESYLRTDLPGTRAGFEQAAPVRAAFDPARCPFIAKQLAAENTDRTDQRAGGSAMIAAEQPKPVLRPSPGLSIAADAAAFNTRMAREHHAARLQSFKAHRLSMPLQQRFRSREER